ncbi:MAG: hypothetical protein RLP44_08940 [Aggregatilineales bacterium]
MNGFLLVAGLLCLIATPAHIYGGEYTLRRTSTGAFPEISNGDASIAKQEIRFGWHMVTVDLLFSGLVLLWLAVVDQTADHQGLLTFIALHFAGYAVVIALLPMFALHRIEPLYRSPQWLLCLVIAVLAYLGAT